MLFSGGTRKDYKLYKPVLKNIINQITLEVQIILDCFVMRSAQINKIYVIWVIPIPKMPIPNFFRPSVAALVQPIPLSLSRSLSNLMIF